MQSIINYNLDKRNSIAPNLYEGNNSEEILINLKYPGQKDLKKIGEALLMNELKPWLNKQDKSFPLKLLNWY